MKYLNFFLILFSFNAFASDHIDGVPSLKNQHVDLSDLYVFPTPDKQDSLTVILNLYPGVVSTGHFSEKVKYKILIKALEKNSSPKKRGFTITDKELHFECSFTAAPHHNSSNTPQAAICKLKNNNAVLAEVSAPIGKTVSNGNSSLKLFAGHRADSFFISQEHFSTVTERSGSFPDPHQKWEQNLLPSFLKGNLMDGLNVLSIALEFDLSLLSDLKNSLIGLSALSYTDLNKSLIIFDRIGRPEITNLSLHAIKGAKKIKRGFNSRASFLENNNQDESDVAATTFFKNIEDRLIDNIGYYDTLDSRTNWEQKDLEALAFIFTNDFITIDTSLPCLSGPSSYLEIESALLKSEAPSSCGGRRISDDVMNRLYTFYIGGMFALNFDDFQTGVSTPYLSSEKNLSANFPYLAPAWNEQWPLRVRLLNAGKDSQEGSGK